MFGDGALAALGLLLLLAVVTRESSLFLLSSCLLGAAGLSRLWERRCLKGVEYRRRFDRTQVSFGESVELEIEVVNRKLLPLSWLEVEDEIPEALRPARGRVLRSHKSGRALLGSLLSLRPYERVRRRYVVPGAARGEHVFGPVRLRSGDLFGFVTREEALDVMETIVVYPRVVPLTDLGLPAHQPLGDLRARSWLFEDDSRLAGAREYRPGDGLRRIHWPATARAQRLQSRVYEVTTSHRICIFLDLSARSRRWWGLDHDPATVELAITTAASLAAWGLERGYQVGLATNGSHRWSWGDVVVPPSSDPGQLRRVLLALGRLQPFAVGTFEGLLARETARLPFGATVVVVGCSPSEATSASLEALRRRGCGVVALLIGAEPAQAALPGVRVWRVEAPTTWREVQSSAR